MAKADSALKAEPTYTNAANPTTGGGYVRIASFNSHPAKLAGMGRNDSSC
jgi:hypothetical protein